MNLVDDGTLSAEGAIRSSNGRVNDPHAVTQHSKSNKMIIRAPTVTSVKLVRCIANPKSTGNSVRGGLSIANPANCLRNLLHQIGQSHGRKEPAIVPSSTRQG